MGHQQSSRDHTVIISATQTTAHVLSPSTDYRGALPPRPGVDLPVDKTNLDLLSRIPGARTKGSVFAGGIGHFGGTGAKFQR